MSARADSRRVCQVFLSIEEVERLSRALRIAWLKTAGTDPALAELYRLDLHNLESQAHAYF